MKKILFVIMLLFVPLLSSCGTYYSERSENIDVSSETSIHFVKVYYNDDLSVYVHKDTRILYVRTYHGGFDVIYDVDGMPFIYDGAF